MTYLQFKSILDRLDRVDMQGLTEAEVIDENWGTRYASHRDQLRDFLNNPFTEFLRMPPATGERLFRFLEEKK